MFTVFLVDDDPGVLKALSRLLRAKGYEVRPFASPEEFLAQHDAAVPGCAVLDVSMPGLDGLELQEALTAGGVQRPIIFITGKSDIPTSVRAMKAGAVDFLTKPVSQEDLFAAIARGQEQDGKYRSVQLELASIQARIETLTPREREVLVGLAQGKLNKQIAGDLGIVEQTVKFHRARIMERMRARSAADLLLIAAKLELR
jgi:FixJ family two-component response regulator